MLQLRVEFGECDNQQQEQDEETCGQHVGTQEATQKAVKHAREISISIDKAAKMSLFAGNMTIYKEDSRRFSHKLLESPANMLDVIVTHKNQSIVCIC